MFGERGVVPSFFQVLGLGRKEALGLTFSCNLISGRQEKPEQPPIESLRPGSPTVMRMIEQTQCKCVIALLRDVYTIIHEVFSTVYEEPLQSGFLQRSDMWKPYKPPWSLWQTKNGSHLLIARLPNHPSYPWRNISEYGRELANLAGKKRIC